MSKFKHKKIDKLIDPPNNDSDEVSDEILASVVGGLKEWGPAGYSSTKEDIIFKFHIGDRVEIKPTVLSGIHGTVIKCFIEYNGTNYEPYYSVKLDKGEVRDFSQNLLSY